MAEINKKSFPESFKQSLLAHDNPLVAKARVFSQLKHKGQNYGFGTYFAEHIEKVVQILLQLTSDPETLAAAYLHDTLEDTPTTYRDLVNEFGVDIAGIVLEVTKTEKNCFPNLHSKKAIMIKFADRLCNISNMGTWNQERQQAYLDSSRFWVK